MDYQPTSAEEEYLSKEQFCKECHISKATALYLIKSRLIPAINTQKQTKRYLIARSDMLVYLKARELDPTLYKYQKSYSKKHIKAYSHNRATRTYAVTSVKIIASDDWSNLQATSDNRITLTTCLANHPEKRICVQAVQIFG